MPVLRTRSQQLGINSRGSIVTSSPDDLGGGADSSIPGSTCKPKDSTSRHSQRAIIRRLQDRLQTKKNSFVQRILRAYDKEGAGGLTPDSLCCVLDRLNTGLSSGDKQWVVGQLQAYTGRRVIPFGALLDYLAQQEPLGPRQMDDGSLRSAAEQAGAGATNARTRAPWEPLVGEVTTWAWQLTPQGVAGITGTAPSGSYEEAQEDSLLLSLVSEKLGQDPEKLRRSFRSADRSGNGLLSKAEFVSALQQLQLAVPRSQLERLFDMSDANGSGEVDYTEFVAAFDALNLSRQRRVRAAATAAEAAEPATLAPTPRELADAAASPLAHALRVKLAAKHTGAHAVFRAYDANRDGYLSLKELTRCCQELVPGVDERLVAGLLASCDASSDRYLSYHEFIQRVVDGAAPHPRMTARRSDAAPPTPGPTVTRAWGHSPFVRTAPASLAATTAPQLPTTAWSPDDLPCEGYTGVVPLHLRPRKRMGAEVTGSREGLHAAGVASLVQSLMLRSSPTSAPPPAPAADAITSSTPTSAPPAPPPATASAPAAQAAVAAAPWDYQGAPPLPLEIVGRRQRAPVPGARTQLQPSTDADVADVNPQRQKRAIPGAAAEVPEIPRRWWKQEDEDAPDTARSMPDVHSAPLCDGDVPANSRRCYTPGPMATRAPPPGSVHGASAGRAATTHVPRRGKAFYLELEFPDTTHVVSPLPTSALWCDTAGTWVRKGDPGYLEYQQNDRKRVAHKRAALLVRQQARDQDVAAKAAQADANRGGNAAAVLQRKARVKTRYIERCALFERARDPPSVSAIPIFSRAPFFMDHLFLDPLLART